MTKNFEDKIGYNFNNKALLSEALTHSSAAKKKSYERLEFLGDRVLGLVIANMLYDSFKKENEGDMAKRLNALVNKETLRKVADQIQLVDHIESSGKSVTPSMAADVIEALIAALYLDGGFDIARKFIAQYWQDRLHKASAPPEDEKSKLQEWAQGKGLDLPEYTLLERSGPDHQPHFIVEAKIQGYPPQKGEGVTKQRAEKSAAKALYQMVKND